MSERPLSQPQTPSLPEQFGAHWIERKPIPIERAFFAFELAFAKEMGRRLNVSIEEAILKATWNLSKQLFDYDRVTSQFSIRTGVNLRHDEDTITYAHAREVSEIEAQPPVPYHLMHGPRYEKGGQFGCHYYLCPSALSELPAIGIHFTNSTFSGESPLSPSNITYRKIEIRDMLQNVAVYHSEVTTVVGKSWLYHLPQYCQLYPESYLANRESENDPRHWCMGSTIWGQFLDATGRLKKDRAERFLKRLKELPPMSITALQSQLSEEGLLLLPQTTIGPIADFYEMYDIKQ